MLMLLGSAGVHSRLPLMSAAQLMSLFIQISSYQLRGQATGLLPAFVTQTSPLKTTHFLKSDSVNSGLAARR